MKAVEIIIIEIDGNCSYYHLKNYFTNRHRRPSGADNVGITYDL